jgi:stage II sporulation protein D
MSRLKLLIILYLTICNTVIYAQVKVRLFSSLSPQSVVFSVTKGNYEAVAFNGEVLNIGVGEPVIISRFEGRLAVKTRGSKGLICDSLLLKGKTGFNSFSLRINGNTGLRRFYSGDLKCFSDLGTVLLINICDIEKYIAGVVKAEGGNGKNKEYFKTQAVIVRTYLYKYFNKHLPDRYNVCDNTHCQVFKGSSFDTIINRAALETRGLVILDRDSVLIVSPFHSNCGGETASSEDVWLTTLPYLKTVVDPYCLSSRNAVWEKHLSIAYWTGFLRKSGYKEKTSDPSVFNFLQESRSTDYKTGSFTMPFLKIRNDLNLRSAFFSVYAAGDSIVLRGRGYGHGVGLCQEGAMAMAKKGFSYQQIIAYYFTGVFISDIKNAVVLPMVLPPNPPFWGSLPYLPPGSGDRKF